MLPGISPRQPAAFPLISCGWELCRTIGEWIPPEIICGYRLPQSAAGHQRIINYIDANYTTLQNVSQIAECCGVSESYIHRIIKKNTSLTVKEYINKLRLRHAIHEMDCSNNSFAIISKACGFQNISYFYYLFKKNYGLTPTEYREQLKKTHK